MLSKSLFLRSTVAFILVITLGTDSIDAAEGSISLNEVDTITILPIVFPADQTAEDRSENLESLYGKLDDYIYKALLRKLAMKGYVLDKPRDWSAPDDWSVERLKTLTPQELVQITPSNASYIVLLFVEHIASSNHVVHSSADAKVSAMILHRNSGSVVWQKGTEGEFTEHVLQIFNPLSGPLGMLLTPDKHAAIETAFGKLFADFPEKQY
ncbi:MAG: hypothetical protein KDI83_12305 [Gammaproteobacteria bacterium]|nr:hypothetical protein [Gammaproteobacteria bacterium]